MWWAGRPLDVYLGTRAVAVCDGARLLAKSQVVGVEEGLAHACSLMASIDGAKRRGIALWLSGGLARPFMLPRVAGVRSEAERAQLVSAIAMERTGMAGALRVWTDSGKGRDNIVAVAMQESVLVNIHKAWPGFRFVRSVRPYWADVLRWSAAADPTPRALSVQDCDCVTMVFGANRQIAAVSTMTGIEDRDGAEAVIARTMVAVDLPANSTTAVWWSSRGAQPHAFALSPLAEVSK